MVYLFVCHNVGNVDWKNGGNFHTFVLNGVLEQRMQGLEKHTQALASPKSDVPQTQTSSKFARNTTTKTVVPPNISTRHPFLYDGVGSLVHLLHDTSRDCEDGTMGPMTLLRSKRVCV